MPELAHKREVVVIGAGPAGLATAAMLRKARVPFRLVDRDGAIGGAYGRMDPALVMTTPAKLAALPGLAVSCDDEYATAREYHAYLLAYATAHELAPEAGAIEAVVRDDAGYRVAIRGVERVEDVFAFAVVVATGMFDTPFVPVLDGQPTVRVFHAAEWHNELAIAGHRVVVVGGASSAIEIAEICSLRGCTVTVAARKISISPAKILGIDPGHLAFPVLSRVTPKRFCEHGVTVPAADRGFGKLRKQGAITVRPPVTRVDGARVTFEDGHAADADLVVLATGYRHATPFLPADVERTARGTVRCKHNESRSHRGIFVVGSPCARSAASQYLYGMARDADAVADVIANRR